MIDQFFSEYREFDQRRRAQRQNGSNDYNVIGALLKANDEVRLHSRFLYSMMNPKGAHNQESIFAELFMSVIGYPNWFEWKNLKARRETDFIDIHLTDGKRHVVIENKLNAPDQPRQLERYIKFIHEEEEVESNDILVVYISKGRKQPTTISLGQLQFIEGRPGEKSYLIDENGNKKGSYCNCHYDREILAWIDRSLDKVKSIPNLTFALNEYRHIVEVATKTYKSKVMNLEDFLKNSAGENRIRYACEIAQELPKIKAGWLSRVLNQDILEILGPQLDAGELIPISTAAGETFHVFDFKAKHAEAFFRARGGVIVRTKASFGASLQVHMPISWHW